jgi:hypothetical protein
VEFTANDRQETCEYDIDGTRGYEVLLRKILQYPRAPAVVLVHWWSPLDQANLLVNCADFVLYNE